MNTEVSTHLISPHKVLRGNKAWEEGKDLIPLICKNPLLIGRSNSTINIRDRLRKDLLNNGLKLTSAELEYDCCYLDITKLNQLAIENGCDGVIAAGGGKVLDAGKLIADQLNLPAITIPLSAATCAGWTALSNIYNPQGSFIKDKELSSCPTLLIFEHEFIKKAPKRTLASGIADAIAKWYEASLTSTTSNDGLVQQAVQMARVLRDQLFIDSIAAYQDPSSEAWIRVAEGCALTAGLIGGIGGSKCRTAAAHAVHNGLTQIKASEKYLHGEIVCYGILVQLRLEEIIAKNQLAKQSRLQLIPFLEALRLPTTLEDIGFEKITLSELESACEFACNEDSEIHTLPFKVNSKTLLEAMIDAGKQKSLQETSKDKNPKSIDY